MGSTDQHSRVQAVRRLATESHRGHRGRSSVIGPVLFLVAVLAGTPFQNALGQEERRLRITPVVGGVFFLEDVDVPDRFDESVRSTSFDDAFLVGLELGFAVDSDWELEASFLLAPESGFTAISSNGVGARFSSEIIYLSANALRYLARGDVRPFLSAGLGSRSQDVFGIFGGASNFAFAGNFGGGVSIVTSPEFSVRLGAKDYVSSFDEVEKEFEDGESSVQHDLVMSVGAAVHVF